MPDLRNLSAWAGAGVTRPYVVQLGDDQERGGSTRPGCIRSAPALVSEGSVYRRLRLVPPRWGRASGGSGPVWGRTGAARGGWAVGYPARKSLQASRTLPHDWIVFTAVSLRHTSKSPNATITPVTSTTNALTFTNSVASRCSVRPCCGRSPCGSTSNVGTSVEGQRPKRDLRHPRIETSQQISWVGR